jgi:FKBP-type peptidyl-prolyl cis-trans isomerase
MGNRYAKNAKRDVTRRRRRGDKKETRENDDRLERMYLARLSSKTEATPPPTTKPPTTTPPTPQATSDTAGEDPPQSKLKEVETANGNARNSNAAQDESPPVIESAPQAEQNAAGKTGMTRIEKMKLKKQRRKALNKAKAVKKASAQTKEHSAESAQTKENNSQDLNPTPPSTNEKRRKITEDSDLEQATSATAGADKSPSVIESASQAEPNASDKTGMTRIEKIRLKKQLRKDLIKAKIASAQTKEHIVDSSKKTNEGNTKDVNPTPPSANEKKRKQNEVSDVKQTKQVDEWKTLRLGVKYRDIQLGKGPFVQDRKKVHVNYTLRANSASGKVVDSGTNFRFRVGKGEVIKGWDIGLSGMRQGSIRQLLVPPEAGYGRKNIGAGVGATLFFQIDLLVC